MKNKLFFYIQNSKSALEDISTSNLIDKLYKNYDLTLILKNDFINKSNIFFLKKIKKINIVLLNNQNSFRFGGHPLTPSQTYLSKITQFSENDENNNVAVPETESWLKFIRASKFDLIWTNSVFTHTFPSTTLESSEKSWND